jgi:hypothetical protein
MLTRRSFVQRGLAAAAAARFLGVDIFGLARGAGSAVEGGHLGRFEGYEKEGSYFFDSVAFGAVMCVTVTGDGRTALMLQSQDDGYYRTTEVELDGLWAVNVGDVIRVDSGGGDPVVHWLPGSKA